MANLADDSASIATRLRELRTAKGICGTCDGSGWIKLRESAWYRCAVCGNPLNLREPRASVFTPKEVEANDASVAWMAGG